MVGPQQKLAGPAAEPERSSHRAAIERRQRVLGIALHSSSKEQPKSIQRPREVKLPIC